MNGRIYLDHAATTPLRAEVIDVMAAASGAPANPSSIHAEGRAARSIVDRARSRVAIACGVRPSEIVFTGGGSEANNLAIFGVARALRDRGRHVVTTAVEHSAVLRAFEALRDEGWLVTVLDVDTDGRVDPAAFRNALRSDTVFAAVMSANNEIGTIEPVAELAAIARERGIVFHADAVQAAGQLPVPPADTIAFSAHKIGGPAGVGILVVREGTALAPLVYGGGQERGRRSGTENVAGIAGAAEAFVLAETERSDFVERTGRLRDRLIASLLAAVPDARLAGPAAGRLANNACVAFADVPGDALLIRLDLEGIAASAGSACAAGAIEPSHVLRAIGLPLRFAAGTIRFSLGRATSGDEIERASAIVSRTVSQMRAASSAVV